MSENAFAAAQPPTAKDQLLAALRFRRSIKLFDPNRAIPDEDFAYILEAARLTPSSFGIEPWNILVVQDRAVRRALIERAGGQERQLGSASHLVLLTAKTAALVTADSPYIHHVAHDVHGIPESDLVGWRRGFAAFQADALGIAGDDRATADWALRQAYLPLANMMTMAAILGIDSCPMEGYFPEAAATVLAETGAFDPATDRLGPMLALGYRAEGLPWPQTRRPIEEIVHYLG